MLSQGRAIIRGFMTSSTFRLKGSRKGRKERHTLQGTAKKMYTSLLFPSHWPHPVTREAWKHSLYSGQPHASLKFGGSIIIDEENNAIRKLPAVLPISPASSILFYMPALLHFFRLLLPLPGALRPQTQPLRKFLYHLLDSWRDITPSMKPS